MVYAEDDVDSPYVQHRMNRSDCIARQGNTRMFNNTARSVRYSRYIEEKNSSCTQVHACI